MERFVFWTTSQQGINASCRECDWRAEFLPGENGPIDGTVVRETLDSHDCLRDRD